MARPRYRFGSKELMDLASKMLEEQVGDYQGPVRPTSQGMEALGGEELTGDPNQELKSLAGVILEGRPKYRQAVINPVPQWIPIPTSTFISAARLIRPGPYPLDLGWNHPYQGALGLTAVGYVYNWQIHVRMLRDGHEHAYEVPPQVPPAFRMAVSKGQFIRRVLMGYQWSPWNRAHRYPHWALSHGEAPPPA